MRAGNSGKLITLFLPANRATGMQMTLVSRLLVLSLLLALLSACGTAPVNKTAVVPAQPVSRPAPVVVQPVDPNAVQVIAYRPSPKPAYTRPQPVKAVQVLQRRAADQRAAGPWVAAAGSLERALRIEPRNPVLWNQLAHVRMEQQQYHLASGLAAKSNAFTAGADASLRKDNQAIIARAKRNR